MFGSKSPATFFVKLFDKEKSDEDIYKEDDETSDISKPESQPDASKNQYRDDILSTME